MTIKYKIKKTIRKIKEKIYKKISTMKIDKKFYLCTTMILILIFTFFFARPYKAPFIEVEIKNVSNYSFQITSEGLNKTIPFHNVKFKSGYDTQNLLKGDILYLYRRFHK